MALAGRQSLLRERRPHTQLVVHLERELDADEAALLQAVFAGETFGDLCERATDFHAHDGPLRAASVLKRWLADGLLAIDPPAPTHD